MALAGRTGIVIKVEFFGTAKLATGIREVELVLPMETSRREFVRALADACPKLVDQVIREDLCDLQEGYVLNRNGLAFLAGDVVAVSPGDSLLILSSQAGG